MSSTDRRHDDDDDDAGGDEALNPSTVADAAASTPPRGAAPQPGRNDSGNGGGSGAAVPPTPAAARRGTGGGGGGDDSSDDSSVGSSHNDGRSNNMVPNNDEIEDDDEAVEVPGQDQLFGRDTVAYIRGTDVHVPTAMDAFNNFLQSFISLRHSQRQQRRNRTRSDRAEDDDDSEASNDDMSDDDSEEEPPPPFYTTKLQEMLNTEGVTSLEIDCMHLFYHNEACQRFYHHVVQNPAELIPLMDILVQRELERLAQHEQADTIPTVQVRPYNLKSVSNLRELDPVCMDTLICCRGMIVRGSAIIPDLKVAHFSCTICGNTATVAIDRGRIAEPAGRCPRCNTAAWQLDHNRCIFADKQLVRLQETPAEVPAGQTPASVVTFCFDDLVDTVMAGDKVEVTGVLRAQPVRVNPKISKVKSVYKTYVDVIHFRTVTGMESVRKENLMEHGGKAQWTKDRIQQLKDLSQDPDIYQKLTESLAPSIWELENCKKGILCMLFGGNHVRVKKGTAAAAQRDPEEAEASWMDDDDQDVDGSNGPGDGSGKSKLNKRGDINILLCGDPGTSKSQLLSYVNKLSARGVYTSGKGSSAVGLTASVVRDPETRDLVLESGALVLSDLGICCIDEFEKMAEQTRSVLHEAMEQQTVSIAKAGIIATLHARTAVLAAANPSESRYNPNRSVVDNIQLPPTLLSRFDLIYLILDAPNVEHDRRLAQHLVGLYYETPNVLQPPMDQALLRDYIEYARENIHPEISDEASAQLVESYLEMRNPSGGAFAANGTRTISATARQLESLIRISEALAKMRYSNIVTRADAKEAVRLMKVATQTAATDPRTGRIDMDMITTGRSSTTRQLEEQIDLSLRELFQERRGRRMAVRDVTQQLSEINDASIPNEDVVEGLRRMHADGVVQFNERAQTVFVRAGVVG